MNEYIGFFDGLSKPLKILFAIPMLDITWVIYRLLKSISSNNTAGIILAIVMIFFAPFLWIIDIICIIINDKVWWLE